jgi:Ca2+-binding EF-hand superfamily protein
MKSSFLCLASFFALASEAAVVHVQQLQLRGMQPAPGGVTNDTDTLAGETIDQATQARSKDFAAIDANGDGIILLWEYLKTTKDDERLATYKFECTDGNLNGQLDTDEFNYIQTHTKELDECLGSMFAFKMIDKNHDGFLSQKEMWKTVGSMRFDQRWAFMIACSDPNQDGKVSPMEFSGEIYDCVERKVNVANEDFVDFKKSDLNENGCVDEPEMAYALTRFLGHNLIVKGKAHYGGDDKSIEHLAISWIDCVDKNGDHCLDTTEYEILLDPDDNHAYCLGTSFEMYEYDMDFAIMDGNHDGRVTLQEYYTWIGRIESEVDKDEADALFHATDSNGDGIIDPKEFHHAGSGYEGDGPNALFFYAFNKTHHALPRHFNKTHHPIGLKKGKKI